jgi:hypothetical protein
MSDFFGDPGFAHEMGIRDDSMVDVIDLPARARESRVPWT